MTARRCLVIAAARPSKSGAPPWRRFLMLVQYYRSLGMEVGGLILADDPLDAAAAARLRSVAVPAAVAKTVDAPAALAYLDRRHDFDVVHIAAFDIKPWTAARLRAVRLVDLPDDLSLTNPIEDWRIHTDLFVAYGEDGAQTCRDAGAEAIVAPYLRSTHRLARRRSNTGRALAGLWVEDDLSAVAAAQGLLDLIRRHGVGNGPNFIVAGPAAAAIEPPELPQPVVVLPTGYAERAFYRGVDLLLAPDLGPREGAGASPRYDVTTALELGATPLVSSIGLAGLRRHWRLPQFETFDAFVDYLFERGRDLSEGGLLVELRARADWTWSGVAGAGAMQRAELTKRLRERLGDLAAA